MNKEVSLYEKIFHIQYEIDELMIDMGVLTPERFSEILDRIIKGVPIIINNEVIIPEHKSFKCNFVANTPVFKKILIQRSLVIKLIIEKHIKATSYLKTLRAFKEEEEILFGASKNFHPPMDNFNRVTNDKKKIITSTRQLVIPNNIQNNTVTSITDESLDNFNSILFFIEMGIPVFDISATEQVFQSVFSKTERQKLEVLRKQLADELYQRVRKNIFSIEELRQEKAYIAVIPGILSLNDIRQKLGRFRGGIWYHTYNFAQAPTKPGVILAFGRPLAVNQDWETQKKMLYRYGKEKEMTFKPAKTCEEIVGWFLDTNSQTINGMMYSGYVRTSDVVKMKGKKYCICIGNFNRGGIHVDQKIAKEAYEHIGISRSYKLLI